MSDGLSDDRLDRILVAVETIEKRLDVLVAKRESTDRAGYRADSDVRDVVERRFVKMTEAAIDIGTTLVIQHEGEPPPSNPATMRRLGTLGIVPHDVAEEMAVAARFRNVLAHTYGDAIDHDVVFDALGDLDRYRAFLVAVRDHLESSGAFRA